MSTGMDRRDFLQKAAVGVASIAGAGVLAGCSTGADTETTDNTDKQPAKAKNRVCELLKIEKPVIGAPMSSLTDAAFVAAVSEAGGLGILGAVVGTTLTSDPAEILKRHQDEIRKIRTLTKKPFAVNFPYVGYTLDYLDMILEEKPAAVWPYGVDANGIDELKSAGIKIIGQNFDFKTWSLEAAKASQDAGADIMMIKCYGCGGSIPKPRTSMVAVMESYMDKGITVPMVPGGGITDARGAAAAAALGADGVWVGTRLIVTNESPAHANTKQAIIDLKAADMIEFESAYFSWCHANKTKKSLELEALWKSGQGADEIANAMAEVYLKGMRLGDMENWFLSVSDSVDTIKEMKTCKEVVDELGDAFLAAQA